MLRVGGLHPVGLAGAAVAIDHGDPADIGLPVIRIQDGERR